MRAHFAPTPDPAATASLHGRKSRASWFTAAFPAVAIGLLACWWMPVSRAAERPVPTYAQLRASFASPDHARWGEVPLWWWEGEPMRREVVTWQLETLASQGVRSVCPIQRSPGRCEPPSFSPEWWQMFSYVAKKCKRLGMTLWAYDQVGYGHYGWLEKAAAKAQDQRTGRLKFLTAEGDPGQPILLELPAGRLVGARAYRLNQGRANDSESIDLSAQVHQRALRWTPAEGKWRVAVTVAVPDLAFQLSDQAADTFIDMLYGEVERQLGSGAMGTTFAGMFQDEHPPTPRDVFTERLAELFRQRNGYEIGRAIPALHFDVGPLTPKYRIDYFDAYLALDESCYWKRVYDWTAQRGILTSHDNWGRNDIARQSQGYIDYFRTQRWFSAPGYDDAGTHPIEGRNYYDTKIAASIARLYDRPRVWSEAFHSSGWGRTTDQTLSWLSTNYAFGANLYDEHGLYYAVRASTWEHAAPDPHWRQPYWRYYHKLSDWVARMSYVMAQGTHVVDVAVHYPVVDVLAGNPPGAPENVDPNRYMKLSRTIYRDGIDNDLIDDDSILAAKIEDGRMVVAGNGYQALVFGPERTVRLSVLKKALAFALQGGTVLFVGGYPSATVEHGRDDEEVVRCARELFGLETTVDTAGDLPRQTVSRAHAGGGFCGLLPMAAEELMRILNAHVDRDFEADHGTFYVAHRHIGDTDVYLVQSVAKEPVQLAATFRTDGVPERWDSATGDILSVDSFARKEQSTRISQRFEGNTAQLFVFRPGGPRQASKRGRPGGPTQPEQRLDDNWRFSVIPTRDNRWGEFRWPPANETIGPEIRSFRYAEETLGSGVELGWQQTGFDDSSWQTDRASIGPYWLLLDHVPATANAATDILATAGSVQQGSPITIAGKELAWRPVDFSKSIGLARPMPWGGHSGYPDGAIDRNFIELPAGRKFLFTRIRSPKTQRLGLRVALGNTKARLWVGGVEQPLEDAIGNLPLVKGANDVLLELADGGRGMLYVQAQPPAAGSMAEAARGRVAPDLASAKWIRDRSAGAGYLRKVFQLDRVPPEARLVVTAYTGYRLVINGTTVEEEIGPWAKWTHPESFNVAPFLRQGENVIAAWNQVFAGQNLHGSAEMKGFALALETRDEDGRTWRLASDLSWKGTATEQTGWEQAGFDDTPWQPVVVLGPVGVEPWGSDFLKNVGAASEPRRPLAIDLPSPYLTCFDEVPGIVYDIKPRSARRVGWYRFVAPPGLRQLELNTSASARVWVDGQPVEVRTGRANVHNPPDGMSTVAVRLEMEPGAYGGAAFPVPIGVVLGGGTIQPGLWANFGLPTYSGIGVYRQEVELVAVPPGERVVLDLGQVLVAAEVLVNGQSVGVRLARPFQFDLTDRIVPGRNTIEVRVANTIAPHYTVTNQVSNLGPTDSGLLGPVVLRYPH